jgi:hypothetical protein
VGINTPNPSASLDIVSKGMDGTTKALEINNSAATPKEMVTVLDNNNVGIGVANPLYNLEVGDFVNNGAYISLSQSGTSTNGQTSLAYFTKRTNTNSLTNATSKGWKWFALSDSYTSSPTLANSLFLEGWANGVRTQNVLVANPNGNIGFGIQEPTARVHVNVSTIGTGFRLVDGSQGIGKVLMSDINGYAKWDNPSSQYVQQTASNTSDITISKVSGSYSTIPGLDGFTAVSTGKYLIQFHCFLKGDTTASDKAFYFIVYKNGTQIKDPETYLYVGADSYMAQTVPVIVDIAAGDVITYKFADGTLSPIGLTFRASDTARNFIETIYLGK